MWVSFRRLVTPLLLALSVAGNAYLLLRSPPPVPAPAPPPTALEREPSEESTPSACVAELAACQRAASGMARSLWESALQQGPSAGGAAPELPPAGKGGKPADPGGSVCRVARAKLREQWLEKRDAITAGLGHDLADVPKQRADAERDARRAADALGLDARSRRGFEQEFADLRAKRVAELAPLAQRMPVDWTHMLDGARSMFDGEDALVQQQLGADALARYRDSQTDRRVTILTMTATYAGVDWDEAMPDP